MSRKRSSVTEEEDQVASKRPRSTNEVTVAGYIEKVSMKNFMCHSALEVTLNKRINFIVGRNGSGKSAILAAVVVAFGCKASSTNRASSLKDFIKNGANSATVQVTLCNEGLYAYKPECYGSKIIVIRNIYSGSTPSSYKFKSAKGEIISTKREELDKIIANFNIQVDNPICVLNQDTARTFLASSDTKSKYAIFMKATRLEDVDNLHSKTLNIEANAKSRLKMRKECMMQQQNEIKDLEKKANALTKLQQMKNKTSNLENELLWAMARDEENKLLDLQMKIDKKKENSEPLLKRLERHKEELEGRVKELRKTHVELQEMNENIKSCSESLANASKESKEYDMVYNTSLLKYKQLDKQLEQTNNDMQTVRQEIARSSGNEETERERSKLNESINTCKMEQNKILAIQQTTEMEFNNLRGEFDHFREQESIIKNDKRAAEQTIISKRHQLEKLKVQSDNLTVYGEWMQKLVQRIEECHKQRKFDRKPLGPLGAMLKVQDAQWARAIELEIGSTLRSFACHSAKDAQVLRNLFKEVCCGSRFPGILVSRFTDRVHDISATCVRSPGYQNIFDVLHFSDPNVANCLIDNCGIEGVLLIPTSKEAVELMSHRVPKNCKKGITLISDQYFPYPDYRMYAGNRKARVCLLQVSKQDFIRQHEVDIQTEQQNIMQLDVKLKELHEKIHKNKNRLMNVEQRLIGLRNSKLRLHAQLNELESALDVLPDPQHVYTLKAELIEIQRNHEDLNIRHAEVTKETDELKILSMNAKENVTVIRSKHHELEEGRLKMQMQMGNLKEMAKKEEFKMKECETIYSSHCSSLNKLQELLKNQEKETKEAVECASKVCNQRVITKRRVSAIETELTDCRSYQNVVEEENGNATDILEMLQEKRRKYDENMQLLNDLEEGLKVLVKSLTEREMLYKSIRRIMSVRVLFMFQPLLTTRGYKGDMIFNHEARTLDVNVSPIDETGKRDTKSLSGGERSYSTVAFILSLWECVEPPFYFMDEFDVFMDKVNRRVVMELLQSHAEAHKKHQYVFFTPQDISTVKSCDYITIHKLDDPERSTAN